MGFEKISVLVTAIGGGGHGEQIVKALRLAGVGKYHIVGADARATCPQFAMVDEHVTLPWANNKQYMDALLEVCKRYHIKALFHGCEPELKIFSAERSRINALDIFLPINPAPLIDLCMNKVNTNKKLNELGFFSPRYLKISSREILGNVDFFPVVVKPSVGGGGSANVFIAQNEKELIGLADYLNLENIAKEFMVQEYIGTPDEEYTVGILHDMDGNYINAIAVKKILSGQLHVRMSVENRTTRSELGPALVISSGVSHGYVGRFPWVTEQCKDIAKAIGAKGPINIQCRFVNGKVYVFEINPRFSGTTSIRAIVGYNEPDVLIRKHLFGEEIQTDFDYEEALILRSLIECVV